LLNEISEETNRTSLVFATKDDLSAYLLPLLDEEPEPDDNLMDYGLSSIDMMKLVTHLRENGVDVSFDDLARAISIDGIWACISAVHAKGGNHA